MLSTLFSGENMLFCYFPTLLYIFSNHLDEIKETRQFYNLFQDLWSRFIILRDGGVGAKSTCLCKLLHKPCFVNFKNIPICSKKALVGNFLMAPATGFATSGLDAGK